MCFRVGKPPAEPPQPPIDPILSNGLRKQKRAASTSGATPRKSAKLSRKPATPPKGAKPKELMRLPKNLYSRAYHSTLKQELLKGCSEAKAKEKARLARQKAMDDAI